MGNGEHGCAMVLEGAKHAHMSCHDPVSSFESLQSISGRSLGCCMSSHCILSLILRLSHAR